MSISKVLCIAVAGSVLFTGAAMARPDTSGQPPAAKTQQKHKVAKLKRIARGHHGGKHHRKHAKGSGQPQ